MVEEEFMSSIPDMKVSPIIHAIFSSMGRCVAAYDGKHPLPSFSALSYSSLFFFYFYCSSKSTSSFLYPSWRWPTLWSLLHSLLMSFLHMHIAFMHLRQLSFVLKNSLSYLRVPTHLLVTTECIRTPCFFCIDTNAGLDHITWMYDYNIFYKPNFLLKLNALIWNFWIEFYFIYVHCILV